MIASTNMGIENRASPRIPVKLPVSCEVAGKVVAMTAINISKGGMMLVAPEILKVGAMAKLKFELTGGSMIEVKGMIRHAVIEAGCGVEFVEVQAADQEKLAAYLETAQAASGAA